VTLRDAAGGCDEILTVTPATAAWCSTYAAAGAAASAHAAAAIPSDRRSAALVDGGHAGRPRSVTEHLRKLGALFRLALGIGYPSKKI